MFWGAPAFNQDLSKWDVSAVTDMWGMFYSASLFNQDLSKWDVSAVTNMRNMFYGASSFNQDLSKWDVSAVTNMYFMFSGASTFNRKLCGVAWVNSKADKTSMFQDSPGSISPTACTTTRPGMVVGITHFAFMGYGQGESETPPLSQHRPIINAVHTTPVFSPQSKKELSEAVAACTLK